LFILLTELSLRLDPDPDTDHQKICSKRRNADKTASKYNYTRVTMATNSACPMYAGKLDSQSQLITRQEGQRERDYGYLPSRPSESRVSMVLLSPLTGVDNSVGVEDVGELCSSPLGGG
jgi:hypothetical protein